MSGPWKKFFTKHLALKLLSLALALLTWFYIVNELNKSSAEDIQFLRKLLPGESFVGKKLVIKPIFIGTAYPGYRINSDQAVVAPEYCIVVGVKKMLEKIKFVYTMPIDLKGASKTFTASVALNPIAPGVFMEEALVQVTVPIEKEAS